MKKRFSEEQIIGFLGETNAGLPIKELCRRHGFSEASCYLWRSKFGHMSVPQIIQTPTGERLVVLPEQEYHALLARLEDQDDIDAANAVVARGEESFPEAVVDALLEGVSPVKVYREYRGLRAGELAGKTGISQGYLSEIESGKKSGSLSVLKRIAAALDVELSDLT